MIAKGRGQRDKVRDGIKTQEKRQEKYSIEEINE